MLSLKLYLNPLLVVSFIPDGKKDFAQSLTPNPKISLKGGAISQHFQDISRHHLGRFNRNFQHGLRAPHSQHIEHFHSHDALLFQAAVSIVAGLELLSNLSDDYVELIVTTGT
jgi:hypothetical protein